MIHKRLLLIVAALYTLAQNGWSQAWTKVGTKEALNAVIADGAQIRLTADIALSEYLKIGQSGPQSVTIDLNGHTLSRSLSAVISNGHVIEVFTQGTLTVTGGTLSGGWATNGGGICNFGNLTLNNVAITGCKATDGGGIHNKAGATLTITGGSIKDCRSDAGGGAVVNYGTATISGCTMSSNITTTRGGAIWSNNTLDIEGCTFTGNDALAVGGDGQNEGDGGAIHINGGTATLIGVTITGNKSKDAGGIYVSSCATLSLGGNSSLTGNVSSEHGCGAIVNQGTTSLSGTVSITGNRCKTNDGGIWNNGTLQMQGGIVVSGNTLESGVTQNVFLKKDKVITVKGAFTTDASIGVYLETINGTFTSGYNTYNSSDPGTYFKPDIASPSVTLSGGEATLSTPEGQVYYID